MRGKVLVGFGALALALLGIAYRVSYRKTTGPFEDKILDAIHRCPPAAPCTLKISDFTSFDWDTAQAFYHGTKQERSDLLGTEDVGYQEGQRQLVFLKKGDIVFQESEPTDQEAPVRNQVLFDSSESSGVVHADFGPETMFEVQKQRGPNGPYYLLRSVHEKGKR